MLWHDIYGGCGKPSFGRGKDVRVSYSAPATAYLPLWAAKDAGIFDRNNLKVELLYVGSSPIALAALLGDEIDVLAGGGTVAPTAYLQGFKISRCFRRLIIACHSNLYASSGIADVAGLRGKRFGVTRFGGSSISPHAISSKLPGLIRRKMFSWSRSATPRIS